jgi:hypothetical protein
MHTLTLNPQQSILITYLYQYRKLVKEIGDCIDNYQAGYGIRRLVEKYEQDWLKRNFYPKLEEDLYQYISYLQAHKVKDAIDRAATVLSKLNKKEAYKKYNDTALILQDIAALMDAFSSTEVILMAIMPSRREEMVCASQTL